MECNEFKHVAGAEPQRLSIAAREHMARCDGCARYAQHMLSLDALLKRALQVPVGPKSVPRSRVAVPRRWLAIAASVLLSVVIPGGAWLALPRVTLAGELIEHVSAE